MSVILPPSFVIDPSKSMFRQPLPPLGKSNARNKDEVIRVGFRQTGSKDRSTQET